MGLFSFIGRLFGKRKRVGLGGFWRKEQTYQVEFETIFSNNSSHEKNLNIIHPLPYDSDVQKVTAPFVFNQPPHEEYRDEKFHNHYALFRLQLPPGKQQVIKINFHLKVTPEEKILSHFSLDDYHHNPSPHLEANRFLIVNEEIKRIAAELVGNDKNLESILKKINHYVIEKLHYGNPIRGLYSSEESLRLKKVDCGGFDTLFVSICLALGIPARIVSGFWLGYPHNSMHAWVEVMLPDGIWIPADPSVEKLQQEKRTKKEGRLGCLGSDRLRLSIGCDIPIPLDGRTNYLPILQHPVIFAREGLTGLEVQTDCRSQITL
ncbi:MAG: transglutaminase domain-containing protein [Anaplasmataceae bacterium]|nr:transglutaminase domain-containing protein [Anaplasmataceae bacterium]